MAESTSRNIVVLPGSGRKIVPGARVIGPNDPEEQIQVTIRVRSRASSADALSSRKDCSNEEEPRQEVRA